MREDAGSPDFQTPVGGRRELDRLWTFVGWESQSFFDWSRSGEKKMERKKSRIKNEDTLIQHTFSKI